MKGYSVAKKVTVTMVDDYDGASAANETVHFSIDGGEYEIDLSPGNANRLRQALEPWTVKARKVSRRTRKALGASRFPVPADREDNHTIRAWARAQGYPVGVRGRLPVGVLQAYESSSK